MKRWVYHAVLILVFFFQVPVLGQGLKIEKRPSNSLVAQRSPSAVRLFWSMAQWPEGADRLVVKRRSAGRDGAKWSGVSGEIRPGWLDDDQLEGVEPSKPERERLAEGRDELFRFFSDPDIARTILSGEIEAKHPSQWQAGSRHWLNISAAFTISEHGEKGYDFALYAGLGCVDRSVQDNEAYEYGLFTVDKKGDSSAEPLVVQVVPELGVVDLFTQKPFAGRRKRGGTEVRFAVSTDLWRTIVFGFHVTRAPLDDTAAKVVINDKATIWQSNEDADEGVHRLVKFDKDADPAMGWRYILQPLDMFGQPFDGASIVIDYKPEPVDD